jgi:RNA polymerase sigma factor (sigma-70 family)
MATGELDTLLRHLRRTISAHEGMALPDAQLLERFLTLRDEAAFELLIWRHGAMVLGVCQRILRREQDVEDAFQATFLTLVKKASSLNKRQAVGSWLYKVAYRIACSAQRQATKKAWRERPLLHSPAAESSLELVWRDLRTVLDEEVNRLPEKYRAPFLLCYLEGKTNDEAARHLGCPKGTVLSRLSRARERLRSRLLRRGVTLSAGLFTAVLTEKAAAATVPAAYLDSTLKAALSVAAGPLATACLSTPVVALTQGAIRAMFWSELKFAAATLLVLGAAGMGATVWSGWVRGQGQPEAQVTAPQTSPEPAQAKPQAKPAAPRTASEDQFDLARQRAQNRLNLKSIVLALHMYHDTYKHFPAPAIYGKDNRALLSWRVALLPYLEQGDLYKQFKLDEPWDSPHNKKLLGQRPRVYEVLGGTDWAITDSTFYQVFVGKGAAFEKRRTLPMSDFTDGTSNTIMVIQAGQAVPWTKPEDLVYDPDEPLPQLWGPSKDALQAAFADGAVHNIKRNVDEAVLRTAITRNQGEVLDFATLFEPETQVASGPIQGDLRKQNQQLKQELQEARAELDRARADLDLAKHLIRADEESAKLMEENVRLEKTLKKTRQEIQEIRAQVERLRDDMEKRLRRLK